MNKIKEPFSVFNLKKTKNNNMKYWRPTWTFFFLALSSVSIEIELDSNSITYTVSIAYWVSLTLCNIMQPMLASNRRHNISEIVDFSYCFDHINTHRQHTCAEGDSLLGKMIPLARKVIRLVFYEKNSSLFRCVFRLWILVLSTWLKLHEFVCKRSYTVSIAYWVYDPVVL